MDSLFDSLALAACTIHVDWGGTWMKNVVGWRPCCATSIKDKQWQQKLENNAAVVVKNGAAVVVGQWN